jgi:DNA-binding beta-propeller fold protein YncE
VGRTAHALALALLVACTLHAEIDVDANGDDESTSDSGPPPGDPCDPLVGDCPPHQLCMPEPPGSGEFRCEDDTDPQEGHIGEPCMSEHGCAPTLACAPGSMVEGCPAGACCTPLCHHADPDGCLPHLQCELFPDIAGPDIGVCVCTGGDCNPPPPPPDLGSALVTSIGFGVYRVDFDTSDVTELVPGGTMMNERDITIAGDGTFYVAAAGDQVVHRFDVDTGAEHPLPFPPGAAGLNTPTGLAFGSRLYITGRTSEQILRVDMPGSPPIVMTNTGGMRPEDILVSPLNRLWVTGFTDSDLREFDLMSGAFIRTVVPAGTGGLDGPGGVAVLPDGTIAIASRNDGRVLRFDEMGTYLGDVVDPGETVSPWGLAVRSDRHLFVADAMIGLVEIDVDVPLPGPVLAHHPIPGQAFGVALLP